MMAKPGKENPGAPRERKYSGRIVQHRAPFGRARIRWAKSNESETGDVDYSRTEKAGVAATITCVSEFGSIWRKHHPPATTHAAERAASTNSASRIAEDAARAESRKYRRIGDRNGQRDLWQSAVEESHDTDSQ